MTTLLPRTVARPRAASRKPPQVDNRRRDPFSPMARALAGLRAVPDFPIRRAAELHQVDPKSLYRVARREGLQNPTGGPGSGRGDPTRRTGAWASRIEPHAGAVHQLRLPPEAQAVALHLGAARLRHLLLAVGAALQQRADEAAQAAATAAALGEPAAPAAAAAHARPLVLTLPPVLRPAKRQEHGRTLYLPDPEQPTAPALTEQALRRRAAVRIGGFAPLEALARAQGLLTPSETLAVLDRVVAACRRLAAEGRMPANVGALRDACAVLGVPHLTPPATSLTPGSRPAAPVNRK